VRDQQVVCIVTGHGLKGPEIVLQSEVKSVSLEATVEPIAEYLKIEWLDG
jgi:hypothetical protein